MQKQVLRVAGKRNWPLHDQETTDLYVVDCLDIQSGFSIAPAAHIALLSMKELNCR